LIFQVGGKGGGGHGWDCTWMRKKAVFHQNPLFIHPECWRSVGDNHTIWPSLWWTEDGSFHRLWDIPTRQCLHTRVM